MPEESGIEELGKSSPYKTIFPADLDDTIVASYRLKLFTTGTKQTSLE